MVRALVMAGIAAVVISSAGVVGLSQYRLGMARAQLTEAVHVNEGNARALAQAHANEALASAVATKAAELADASEAKFNALRQEIDNVPASSDGPSLNLFPAPAPGEGSTPRPGCGAGVGPALLRTLDGLRGLPGGH